MFLRFNEIRMKGYAGACVLNSITRKNQILGSVEKVTEACNSLKIKFFKGGFNQLQQLENLIQQKVTDHRHQTITFPQFTKAEAIGFLAQFIKNQNSNGFAMFICGDGIVGDDNQARFLLLNNGLKSSEFLSFPEILEIWDHQSNKQKNRHLALVLDFSHSGEWVKQLKKLSRDDVSIQASADRFQSNIEIMGLGSLFLNNLLYVNKAPESFRVNPEEVRFSEYQLDKGPDIQNPQFFGDKAKIQSLFGLRLGFDSWKEMFEPEHETDNQVYYVGQTRRIERANPKGFEIIRHGKGSLWKEDNGLIFFGDFQNNNLVTEIGCESSILENSEINAGSLKVDPSGNLIIGYFLNSFLNGNGIIITPNNSKFEGNFKKGYLNVECKFVNPLGWVIEGNKNSFFFTKIVRVLDPNGSDVPFYFNHCSVDGPAILVDKYTNIYFGTFSQGKMTGKFKIINSFGYTIDATFNENFIVHLHRVLDFDQIEVDAKLCTNESNGDGVWINNDCTLYFGHMIDGHIFGFGMAKYYNGNTYEGAYQNNLPHGKGKLMFNTNCFYEGNFFRGKFNGFGRLIDPKNAFYEGYFKKNRKHGKGKHVFISGGVYEGEFQNDERSGFGRRFYKKGNLYVGFFENNLKSGRGSMEWYNNDKYAGEFQSNYINGKGILWSANGDLYEGDFVFGKKSGKGKLIYNDGRIYEDDFETDKMHGKRTMKFIDGTMHQGEFVDNMPHEEAKRTYPNGELYDGQFSNGFPNSKGKQSHPNGGYYEGDFLNGQRNGKGILKYPDGSTYTGDFLDGKQHGFGILTSPNGGSYEGGYLQGKQHGQGILKYPNGNIYEGDLIEKLKHGKGKLTSINGGFYEGEYKNDKQHGKGKLQFPDGSIYEGDFFNDEMEGYGKLIIPEKYTYEGFFKNSKKEGQGVCQYFNGSVYIVNCQDNKIKKIKKITFS